MISVVTAYFNRKKLFYNTLISFKNSAFTNFEVIVVDDGSNEENRLEEYLEEFDFLKIIRIEPRKKWYTNPCIPFNIGFKAAKGDIVIIQNPECMHYGDIFSFVQQNFKRNDYFSFASYSLARDITDGLTIDKVKNINSLSINFLKEPAILDGDAGWYNHSVYDPVGFHWCAAISRIDLLALGGFDERFAFGIAFDDDEFLKRVKKKGMNYQIIDSPFVLHQNHYFFDRENNKNINPFFQKKDAQFLWRKNKYLADKILTSNRWKSKTKSKIHLLYLDFIISSKLKVKEFFSSQSFRIKNKISRSFHKLN